MKTLTCAQMGGMCDTPISGNSEDELMMNGMQHLEAAHPEMAAQVKAMPKDDPMMVEWGKKFKEMYNAAPEQ
jgi:predicted small metal-binding protein